MRITRLSPSLLTLLFLLVSCMPGTRTAYASEKFSQINTEVARAYNDGIMRCSTPQCARFLYACYRSYSRATLQEFVACGSQAVGRGDAELAASTSN